MLGFHGVVDQYDGFVIHFCTFVVLPVVLFQAGDGHVTPDLVRKARDLLPQLQALGNLGTARMIR